MRNHEIRRDLLSKQHHPDSTMLGSALSFGACIALGIIGAYLAYYLIQPNPLLH